MEALACVDVGNGEMCYEGELAILRHLQMRTQQIAKGETNDERPLLFVMGGVQRGVYGAGSLTALHEHGLREVFAIAVGISTGAASLAYFLAGQTEAGSIYYKECLSPRLYNFWGPFVGGDLINTEYLTDIFRGKHNPARRLNIETIKKSATTFLVGLAEYETANDVLYNVSKAPDTIEALRAAISMPWFSKPVKLNDQRYIDGGVTKPFPIRDVIEQYSPTSILVLANSSRNWDYPWMYYFGRMLGRLFLPKALVDKMEAAFKHHDIVFEPLRSSGIPYLIIWSDDKVSAFTLLKKPLQKAMKRAHDFMALLLDK